MLCGTELLALDGVSAYIPRLKSPPEKQQDGSRHRRGLRRQGREPLRAGAACRASRPHDLERLAADRRPRQRQEPGRGAARDRRADLKEDLIHSLQKYVEVDEPEVEAVPLIASPKAASSDGDVAFDRMSEEELLRGLESMVPPDKNEDF
jgi:hypothetical protein